MASLNADQTTELIVFGYTRNIEKSLSNYQFIPTSITSVVLLYVFNYFENRGVHKWRISDPKIMAAILTAKCGDKFESDPFVMTRMRWKFEIYPNGSEQALSGFFIVGLRLLSLPAMIDSVEFGRIFRISERRVGAGWVSSVSLGGLSKWRHKCPSTEILDAKPGYLSIECEVNIHRLILKENGNTSPMPSIWSKMKYPKAVVPSEYHLLYSLDKEETLSFQSMTLSESLSVCHENENRNEMKRADVKRQCAAKYWMISGSFSVHQTAMATNISVIAPSSCCCSDCLLVSRRCGQSSPSNTRTSTKRTRIH